MDPLFKFVEKDNHLKLGDYSFSPITQISAGIALEYCKKVKTDNSYKQPLFLCFPEKKTASLWTSIIVLTNHFFEDYVNNETGGIQFQRLDKVKIFDCIAEVERVISDKVYLKFKDQNGIPIGKNLQSQLSKVNASRQLSLKRTFDTKRKNAKDSRSTISKILIPKDDRTINQNNLDSKILLVAGRGNVQVFNDFLDKNTVYDEPLSKIYPPKKNLIITADLKSYSQAFNDNREKEIQEFKELISILIESLDIEEAKKQLSFMSQKLIDDNIITFEFDNLFKSFSNSFSDEIPRLTHLEKKYPGYQDTLPENIRAVVINDVQQVKYYPRTIDSFLKMGIPVIVISNRNIESNIELDFFNSFFKENDDYFRLNWNRKKIKELIQFDTKETYLDKELWDACERYANQKINITVFSGNPLDSLIPKLIAYIKELDHFEKLQTSFYTNFYPSLYSIKNSKRLGAKMLEMVCKFESDFDLVKNTGIPIEISGDFEEAIRILREIGDNSKKYDESEHLFSNTIPNTELFIPYNRRYINDSDSQTESILFTGYPYNEYIGKYLSNTVFVHFVPKIDILCWPVESSLTHRYLKRRFKSGYFMDNLPKLIPFNETLLIKSDEEIIEEIDGFFTLNIKYDNLETEQEPDLEHLHTFKYKGYGNESGQTNSFKVKCDVMNFNDGSFMFLPRGSSILALSESVAGQTRITQLKLPEIEVGSKIFKYKKDRGTLREISKTDSTIEKQFQLLDTWRFTLQQLYKECDYSIACLEKLLKDTKSSFGIEEGNPIKASIQRWLFDDETIKPDNSNLKIIFYAANIENIDKKLNDLDFAYKSVLSFTIGLSSKIKEAITKHISSSLTDSTDFDVKVKGHEVIVESRIIASKIELEMEVDYHNTRKILC